MITGRSNKQTKRNATVFHEQANWLIPRSSIHSMTPIYAVRHIMSLRRGSYVRVFAYFLNSFLTPKP